MANEIINAENIQEQSEKKVKKHVPDISIKSLDQMIELYKNAPPIPTLWKGITQQSFGFIVGPAKSGKSTLCENLGMSIASGRSSFLGFDLSLNGKVLFISLEETPRNRTDRNKLQVDYLNDMKEKPEKAWVKNYLVASEDFPRFISGTDWNLLRNLIKKEKPEVVFIDSLTRMYNGDIEDSSVAKQVSTKLRDLQADTGITLIVIHHTTKMNGKMMTMDQISGSRVIAQEADFVIGVNKITSGTRYLKDVFYRYSLEDNEAATIFEINENKWCEKVKSTQEYRIFQEADGRFDSKNQKLILRYLSEHKGEATYNDFIKDLVESEELLTRNALSENLKKLIESDEIVKESRGKYKIADEGILPSTEEADQSESKD